MIKLHKKWFLHLRLILCVSLGYAMLYFCDQIHIKYLTMIMFTITILVVWMASDVMTYGKYD